MTTIKTTTIIDLNRIRLDELVQSLTQVGEALNPATASVRVRHIPGDRPWESDSYSLEVTGTPKERA